MKSREMIVFVLTLKSQVVVSGPHTPWCENEVKLITELRDFVSNDINTVRDNGHTTQVHAELFDLPRQKERVDVLSLT